MPRAGLVTAGEQRHGVALKIQPAVMPVTPDSAVAAARLPVAPRLPLPRLQGVDLRLDQFDLSEAKRVSLEVQAGSWGGEVKTLDGCVAVGSAFFACLDGSKDSFKEDDQALLQKVFFPTLSDRRNEGDLFVPPDVSFSYVQQLRTLVNDEDVVRKCREEAFFSQDFVMGNPGPLFPHSRRAQEDARHFRTEPRRCRSQ